MTSLSFPSPAAFTQSLRMRRSGSVPGTRFLVVEGVSDKKSFHPLLDPHLHYVPARGKDMVLFAFETLTLEGVNDCLFVVDCDGGTESKWLGRHGLVISNNRDLDADLLFDLNAFDRVALEYLSGFGQTAEECAAVGQELLAYARALSADFGVVLDAARDTGAPTKVYDENRGSRRRLQLLDFDDSVAWIQNFVPVDREELATLAAGALGWTDDQLAGVIIEVTGGALKACRAHGLPRCAECTPRHFSSGHDLVDILSLSLSQRCGFVVSSGELARATRLAASTQSVSAWSVARRVGGWLAPG